MKILDKSGASIDLSLWNDYAKDPALTIGTANKTVILATGVSVSHFNNNLSLTSNKTLTEISYNPDLSITADLLNWFSGLSQLDFKAVELSEKKAKKHEYPLKTVADIRDSVPNTDERYTTIAYIRYIKTDDVQVTYESCIYCKKKVVLESSGFFQCNNCKKSSKECTYRYLLRSMQLSDFTAGIYCTAFHEVGEFLFKMKAQEFHNKNAEEKKEIALKACLNSYSFVIRASSNTTPDGNTRIEYTISYVNQINPVDVTKRILNTILDGIN